MKVGYFSPLPPARTGVAEYSAALLPALGKLCDVRVDAADADIALYHLGNNQLHREVYERAVRQPGVAVLHDAVLHHFLLGTLGREAYLEEFVYNYGECRRGEAARLWETRAGSAQDPRYFEYALVRRIAEVSRAVVVHNPAAARIVSAHVPESRVVEIPHLAFTPEPALPRAVTSPFQFGVFGHLRESKRLPVVLRAFERVRASGADVELLIAGDFVSSDLERAIVPLLSAPGIRRVPYCPEPEFRTLLSSVDAGINLRAPSAGETSGITIRLMAAGKPVVLTAGEEDARYPENACLRVDSGLAEEAMLAEYMVWLAAHPGTAQEIGRRAAAYVSAIHSPEKAARCYYELLSFCCS